MNSRPERAGPSAEAGLADVSRAVPLTVLVFLVLDAVTTTIAQAHGIPELGPAGPVATAQRILVVLAAALVMWGRVRSGSLATAAVLALVFTVGNTGDELWLLMIVAVTAAVRADRLQLGLVALAQLAYAVAFGFRTESRWPGEGWRTGTGPLQSSGLYAGESYDARAGERGWALPGFDEGEWVPDGRPLAEWLAAWAAGAVTQPAGGLSRSPRPSTDAG